VSESKRSHGSVGGEDFDPLAVPVRDAATVMLVRDGRDGLEVFMLRRTLDAVFAGGMYVFPGGAVDDADRSPDVEAWCDGLTDQQASGMLDVDAGGLAYWIAAIRECFEEAGVLLARRADGAVVRFDEPAVEQRYLAHRSAVHAGSLRLIDLCGADGLRLTTDDIHYVSHWITPVGERRRFDTRFFLARAPQAQDPLHDAQETIASLWVGPADALARHERGELAMIAPTTKNLELLRPHATADEALAAAGALGRPPTIRPKLRVDDRGRVEVVMPGDPDFAALPELDGRAR
jgi:8-oxo-dGTP pyrophosphatase MutT (NUDIX family)